MSAARPNEMRLTALAAIERKILAQYADRQRASGGKLVRTTNRLPEHPEKTAGQCARPGLNDFSKIHLALVHWATGRSPLHAFKLKNKQFVRFILYVSRVLG